LRACVSKCVCVCVCVCVCRTVLRLRRGAGYESEAHYRDCKIKFLNIDNIHDMRASLNALLDLCAKQRSTISSHDHIAEGGSSKSTGWLSGLANCKWLDHTRLILRAALKVARCVHRGHSVLVHCSDGWDRTPQVCMHCCSFH
jgi:myotubularin-related protein 6/7/8